jgi:molybdopterin-containing oxidoreductase family iron-sulfur binding subunit
MKRRDFFKLMGVISGSILASCDVKKAPEKLIPYLVPPEDGIIPGEPVWYKSTCMECPVQCGTLVKNRENRPVKLEGLPGHPFNNGALCVRGQASLERMYHPKRIRTPLEKKQAGGFKPISWQEALEKIRTAMDANKDRRNVYFSGRTTGTLNKLLDEFVSKKNFVRAPELEVIHYAEIREANRRLFGVNDLPEYKLEDADVVITIGADILDTFLNPIYFAQQIENAKQHLLEWFHVEPTLTLTGAKAGKRILNNPGSEHYLLSYLVHHVQEKRDFPKELLKWIPRYPLDKVAQETGISEYAIKEMVHQLNQASNPFVLAGGVATNHKNGYLVALFTAVLQYKLNMINRLIDFTRTWNYSRVGSYKDINTFFTDALAQNPGIAVFSRIHTLDMVPQAGAFLEKAAFKIVITDFYQPYMEKADIILPLSHALESWGDAESLSGVLSVIQPTSEPVFNTRSEGDILLSLMGNTVDYQEYLFKEWGTDAQTLVDQGVIVKEVKRKWVGIWTQGAQKVLQKAERVPFDSSTNMLVITPSIRSFDGRSRVLSLMSEIPDPLTTISYGRWVSISKKDAEEMNIKTGDVVRLETGKGALELPAKVQPGLKRKIFQVHLDQVDSMLLQADQAENEYIAIIPLKKISKTGKTEKIPVLSGSLYSDDRGLLPEEEHEHEHHEAGNEKHSNKHHELYTLYKEHDHPDYRWAMSIDLESCIGCSACVAACYVENNVAITGKEEHLKGREMAWLRIEPYYDDETKPRFVPVMCQQCDNAPCEAVCPVFATYHNPDGLNAQVYNRCVGTRYCSNNCPYKARRFNWFEWERPEPFQLMLNPDVSDRPKGVMEKCTFCIQRIRYAKDHAKDENREVRDGEVIPACAQTCPTKAITFGNLKDKNSKIYKKAHSESAYRLLEELGTRPAVYYLNDVKKGNEHES